MRNLCLKRYPLLWILYSIQIYGILIGQWEEDIHILNSCLTPLLISKYQINPVINVLGGVVTF